MASFVFEPPIFTPSWRHSCLATSSCRQTDTATMPPTAYHQSYQIKTCPISVPLFQNGKRWAGNAAQGKITLIPSFKRTSVLSCHPPSQPESTTSPYQHSLTVINTAGLVIAHSALISQGQRKRPCRGSKSTLPKDGVLAGRLW